MPQLEGAAVFSQYCTWYRITGDARSHKAPLVVIHGGPGSTHDYLDSFAALASDGRCVVHYDQIGNGRSSHLPHAPTNFWTSALFLDELDSLLGHLRICQNYILLGHSWGGMLGIEQAVRQPAGLRALVLANTPASIGLWNAAAQRHRHGLPVDIQTTLRLHEAAGSVEHPDYQAAVKVYLHRHFCRLSCWPSPLTRSADAKAADPTVYATMIGREEFAVTGTLRNWDSVDRLDQIVVPTLLLSGRHDQAAPDTVQPLADGVRDMRGWTVFEEPSHTPHLEEHDLCMATVAKFLTQIDAEA